jgi:membrane fusion protein, multidrug efflux system
MPSGLVGEVRVHLRHGSSPRGNATDRGMAPRTLPADALLEADGDSATIYVLRDAVTVTAAGDSTYSAARQRVAVLGIDGDRVQVQGVAADARVVARGAPYVTPATRLRVVTASANATTSARDTRP